MKELEDCPHYHLAPIPWTSRNCKKMMIILLCQLSLESYIFVDTLNNNSNTLLSKYSAVNVTVQHNVIVAQPVNNYLHDQLSTLTFTFNISKWYIQMLVRQLNNEIDVISFFQLLRN